MRRALPGNPPMTENSPTLRDLQRQETFERLYETALAEFHRVGVDAARVSEICRLARVAKGTFFFHFPTKDHVLLERQRRLSKAMAERIERELADVPDAKAFLGQLIDIVLSEHQAIGDLELVRLINLAIVRQGTQRLSVQHTAFGNALTRQIRHLQQQGVLRKGIDATKLADTLRLSFFGFLLNPVSSLDTSRPRIALLANLLSDALTA
ncbi:MAG: TetR/AcrR family transcriptional regulator [Rhodocyclaceae bacterium]|nr:TetR/AcrR family transcriptional regulator [Rhodocyclaceae bacterium]